MTGARYCNAAQLQAGRLIPPDTQALLDDLHACEAVLGDWREDGMTDAATGARLDLEIDRAKRALRANLGDRGMVVLGDVALAMRTIDELCEPFPWPDVKYAYGKSSGPRYVRIDCVGDVDVFDRIEVSHGIVRRLYTPTVIVDRVTVASINISGGASGLCALIECHEVLEAKPVRWASEYNQRPMPRTDLCPLPAGHRGRCRPDPTEPHGGAIACGRPLAGSL